MKQERNKQLKDKMDQAGVGGLLPDFDKDAHWAQLSERLHPDRKKMTLSWRYAAAAVLILASVAGITGYVNRPSGKSIALDTPAVLPATEKPPVTVAAANTGRDIIAVTNTPVGPAHKTVVNKKQENLPVANAKRHMVRDVICNNTPCPIQICISQTMKCPNAAPKPISTCATLEAAQSAKLDYEKKGNVTRNCSLTIDEIEIKSVVTGETILLNETSAPYTAHDVFSYINGEKKGDILAGVFLRDCDLQDKQKGLRLDNSFGDIIIRQ